MKKIFIAILCALAIAGCGDIDRYPGADEYAPGEGTEQEPGTDPEPEPALLLLNEIYYFLPPG